MSKIHLEISAERITATSDEILDAAMISEIRSAMGESYRSLILDLSKTRSIDPSDKLLLEEFGQTIISDSKSLIFVSDDPKMIAQLHESWNVVPTLPEARDFLEMEEIERKLGLR